VRLKRCKFFLMATLMLFNHDAGLLLSFVGPFLSNATSHH
jgi:hypothetical protein